MVLAADAAAQAAGLRVGMPATKAQVLVPGLARASNALPIAEAFNDLVEPLCKVAVDAAVARSKRLAQGKQVLAAKIIGVDPQSARNHVDL